MHTSLLSPADWAREELGRAALGDKRRADRLVRIAERIAERVAGRPGGRAGPSAR
jgi:Transposase DNA-binding